ncbi:hypothetical protein, partial [Candidatus Venteria ishoeyi]
SSNVLAAPPAPWLAVAEGSHSLSGTSACASTAAGVLRKQGFARVSHTGSTVMGAYRGGSDYEFKAVIKCQSKSAVAFVVTTLSGQGLNKANSLIAGLRGRGGRIADDSGSSTAEPEEEEVYDDEEEYYDE